jgi:hypothetical protein
MKNALAQALSAILEQIALQGGPAKVFGEETNIVTRLNAQGEEEAKLKSPDFHRYLNEEMGIELHKAGVLENNGEIQKLRFGRKNEFVLGIRLDVLKRKVREAEVEASEVLTLRREVRLMKKALEVVRDENSIEREWANLMATVSRQLNLKPTPAAKLKYDRSKAGSTKALAGIPTLMLSDWHWGETVHPDQVEGLNSFDLDIANQRANRVFDKSLELLFHHSAGQRYDGMVIVLGGDMFSGNIHDELRQTNGAPLLQCVIELAQKLADKIVMVAKEFNWIYVPGVVGNHGRMDKKPTAKFAVADNFDNHLYELVKRMVEGRLGDECNVEFDISTSLDMQYKVYNTKYLLTHGDQIKGGAGVGGFWPSMMKTAHRKQERLVATGAEGFDYMICGHFHKYGNVANVIVNGSLKGYDEWVYKMNFGYERPIQALWVTHPQLGIIDHRPVYADSSIRDADYDVPPIIPSHVLQKNRSKV